MRGRWYSTKMENECGLRLEGPAMLPTCALRRIRIRSTSTTLDPMRARKRQETEPRDPCCIINRGAVGVSGGTHHDENRCLLG